MPQLLEQMFDPKDDAFLPAFLAWLVVAGTLLALAFGLVRLLEWKGVRLLPPQRERAVPWTGVALGGVTLLWLVAGRMAADALLANGWFTHLYGPDFLTAMKDLDGGLTHELAVVRYSLWGGMVSFLFLVVLVLSLLKLLNGAELYQMGLTTHRFGNNVLLGVLAWLAVITPILLANLAVITVLAGEPDKHPLEKLANHLTLNGEWLLLVFTAVVIAPVLEELFFRGLMLPWAAQDPYHADWLLYWSILVTLLERGKPIAELTDKFSMAKLLVEVQVFAFILLMSGSYLVLRWKGRRVEGAIFATALLFGCFHASVWPTPVALLLLGGVLAWLTYRTQSLVPAIVLHALFNSVACVMLFAFPQAP